MTAENGSTAVRLGSSRGQSEDAGVAMVERAPVTSYETAFHEPAEPCSAHPNAVVDEVLARRSSVPASVERVNDQQTNEPSALTPVATPARYAPLNPAFRNPLESLTAAAGPTPTPALLPTDLSEVAPERVENREENELLLASLEAAHQERVSQAENVPEQASRDKGKGKAPGQGQIDPSGSGKRKVGELEDVPNAIETQALSAAQAREAKLDGEPTLEYNQIRTRISWFYSKIDRSGHENQTRKEQCREKKEFQSADPTIP